MHWQWDHAYHRSDIQSVSVAGHVVQYDDGYREMSNLSFKAWRFCAASTVCRDLIVRMSDMPDVLAAILLLFGNEPFMMQEAQCFSPYTKASALYTEEAAFKKTQKVLTASALPRDHHTLALHVTYNKICDEHNLYLETRISLRGKDDF